MSDNQNTNLDVSTMNEQGATVIAKLASTFNEQERKEIIRDSFVVMNLKTTTGRDYQPRKLTPYEAFSYVVACRQLGLNCLLDHIVPLEGKIYITKQGHLQNAHASGLLMGMKKECIKSDSNSNEYRYRCTIKKKVGTDIVEFSAEGFASPTTVKGGANKTSLFLEQMAEARATRRCLSDAFPVGLASLEDREIMDMTPGQPEDIPSAPIVPVEKIIEKVEGIVSNNGLDSFAEDFGQISHLYSEEDRNRVMDAVIKRKESFLESVKPSKSQGDDVEVVTFPNGSQVVINKVPDTENKYLAMARQAPGPEPKEEDFRDNIPAVENGENLSLDLGQNTNERLKIELKELQESLKELDKESEDYEKTTAKIKELKAKLSPSKKK